MVGTGPPLSPFLLSLSVFSFIELGFIDRSKCRWKLPFISFPAITPTPNYSHFTPYHLFLFHIYVSVWVYFHLSGLSSHSVFPFLFLSLTVLCRHHWTTLQESQRMQTKLDALTREVFDLQETINWKDKKIGVGGPTWMLWKDMRGVHLLCLSCFLWMMETFRH